MAEHPIRALFNAGVRVTVGTDDPLIFGRTLSEEFVALHRAGLMTAAQLDAVRREALPGCDVAPSGVQITTPLPWFTYDTGGSMGRRAASPRLAR